jgi:hypothetical protein
MTVALSIVSSMFDRVVGELELEMRLDIHSLPPFVVTLESITQLVF